MRKRNSRAHHQKRDRHNHLDAYPFFICAALLLFFFTFLLIRDLSWQINFASLVVAINIVSFILFGHDKNAAKSGASRVPELLLICLALLGGAGGILLGMKLFHHKTRKSGWVFLVTVLLIVQLLALFYLLIEQLRPP